MTETSIIATACIAALAYTAIFMVAFDPIVAWIDRLSEGGATSRGDRTTRRLRRQAESALPLRGLAAEPTVLPRTIGAAVRSPVQPTLSDDAALPSLLARLDAFVPSQRAAG